MYMILVRYVSYTLVSIILYLPLYCTLFLVFKSRVTLMYCWNSISPEQFFLEWSVFRYNKMFYTTWIGKYTFLNSDCLCFGHIWFAQMFILIIYGCIVFKFSHIEYTFQLANIKWPIPLRKKLWYKSKENNNESIDIAKITIFTLSRNLTHMFTSFPLKDYRLLNETLELGFNFSSLFWGNYTL